MRCEKSQFTISQKINLYKEIYEIWSELKATGKKYNVGPSNIRLWNNLASVTKRFLTHIYMTVGLQDPILKVFHHLEQLFLYVMVKLTSNFSFLKPSFALQKCCMVLSGLLYIK